MDLISVQLCICRESVKIMMFFYYKKLGCLTLTVTLSQMPFQTFLCTIIPLWKIASNRVSVMGTHGRPYGGTAVLIRNSICRSHQLLVTCPDICGVKYVFRNGHSILFCNVYMPFDNGYRFFLWFEAVLGYMQGIVDKCLGYKFIFGGDFNSSKHISSYENVYVNCEELLCK